MKGGAPERETRRLARGTGRRETERQQPAQETEGEQGHQGPPSTPPGAAHQAAPDGEPKVQPTCTGRLRPRRIGTRRHGRDRATLLEDVLCFIKKASHTQDVKTKLKTCWENVQEMFDKCSCDGEVPRELASHCIGQNMGKSSSFEQDKRTKSCSSTHALCKTQFVVKLCLF